MDFYMRVLFPFICIGFWCGVVQTDDKCEDVQTCLWTIGQQYVAANTFHEKQVLCLQMTDAQGVLSRCKHKLATCPTDSHLQQFNALRKKLDTACSEVCPDISKVQQCNIDKSSIGNRQYDYFCRSFAAALNCSSQYDCTIGLELVTSSVTKETNKIYTNLCNTGCRNLDRSVEVLQKCAEMNTFAHNCSVVDAFLECANTTSWQQEDPVCPEVYHMVHQYYPEECEVTIATKQYPTTQGSKTSLDVSTKATDSPITDSTKQRSTDGKTTTILTTAQHTADTVSTQPRNTDVTDVADGTMTPNSDYSVTNVTSLEYSSSGKVIELETTTVELPMVTKLSRKGYKTSPDLSTVVSHSSDNESTTQWSTDGKTTTIPTTSQQTAHTVSTQPRNTDVTDVADGTMTPDPNYSVTNVTSLEYSSSGKVIELETTTVELPMVTKLSRKAGYNASLDVSTNANDSPFTESTTQRSTDGKTTTFLTTAQQTAHTVSTQSRNTDVTGDADGIMTSNSDYTVTNVTSLEYSSSDKVIELETTTVELPMVTKLSRKAKPRNTDVTGAMTSDSDYSVTNVTSLEYSSSGKVIEVETTTVELPMVTKLSRKGYKTSPDLSTVVSHSSHADSTTQWSTDGQTTTILTTSQPTTHIASTQSRRTDVNSDASGAMASDSDYSVTNVTSLEHLPIPSNGKVTKSETTTVTMVTKLSREETDGENGGGGIQISLALQGLLVCVGVAVQRGLG